MPPLALARTFKQTRRKIISLRYLLSLPAGYQRLAKARWPLLLFLHGSGERGRNLKQVAIHGPFKFAKQHPDFPFILAAPQCPEDQIWDDDTLIALLDQLLARYRVDRTRLYVTGLSMGGYGAWSLGLKYPELFAAIAPICGGVNLVDLLLLSDKKAAAFRALGVWAFHGGKDPVVKSEESRRVIRALREAGAKDIRLTIYPKAGHDSWTVTYQNARLYRWFLAHQR